ncbi:MAG: GIY-YIG nuclease family protein [Patescibacteria group bacterium]
MIYYAYVLKSKKDSKLYYGFTRNLNNRLIEHNSGKVTSTKYRRPLHLLYFEKVNTITRARRKEKYFKSDFGRKYIKSKLKKTAPSSNG